MSFLSQTSSSSSQLIFGIVAMILVGSSWMLFGIIMGKAPKEKLEVSSIIFFSGLIGLAASLGFGFHQGIPECSSRVLLLVFLSLFINGIFNYLQLEVMSQAMQKGPNGIIWAIAQAGFIIPSLMGILCFNEVLKPLKLFGFFAMLVMLLLFAFGSNEKPSPGQVYGKWKLLALVTFICTGGSQAFSILPSYYPQSAAISSQWRTAFYSLGLCFTALLVALYKNRGAFCSRFLANSRRLKLWAYCLTLQIIEIFGYFFLYYPGMDCLARANIGAIAFPLMVGSCIAAFEIYCLAVLHEKRNRWQIMGLILCLIGIITICM